jgi:Rrf2 family transcriptional regulator, cysteine metabolism repressor
MPAAKLMHISVKCDYALRAVLDLALSPGEQPTRIADIAARQRIPQKFLETILAELKKAGFLASRRGAEGGYLLGRPADTITVGQVLRSLEGDRATRSDNASHAGPVEELWRRVDEAVSTVIDHATFAELAREWRESQSRFVPNWDI